MAPAGAPGQCRWGPALAGWGVGVACQGVGKVLFALHFGAPEWLG